MVSAMISDISFVAGEDKLTLYQFNTKSAKHYFCSICGIYTHHQRRSKPEEIGVNVACLENVSPFQFEVVPVLDGLNHPKDGGHFGSAVGLLKFEKI